MPFKSPFLYCSLGKISLIPPYCRLMHWGWCSQGTMPPSLLLFLYGLSLSLICCAESVQSSLFFFGGCCYSVCRYRRDVFMRGGELRVFTLPSWTRSLQCLVFLLFRVAHFLFIYPKCNNIPAIMIRNSYIEEVKSFNGLTTKTLSKMITPILNSIFYLLK